VADELKPARTGRIFFLKARPSSAPGVRIDAAAAQADASSRRGRGAKPDLPMPTRAAGSAGGESAQNRFGKKASVGLPEFSG
jgi:hypothetical protein